MAKGNIAKENVTKIIIDALGDSFVTVADKKIYAWSEENGEKIQVAISLTCPKTPVAAAGGIVGGASTATISNAYSTSVEISPEDKAKVQELKARLGIV